MNARHLFSKRRAFRLPALAVFVLLQALLASTGGNKYYYNPVPRNGASINSCSVAGCHNSGTIDKSSTNLFLDSLPTNYVPGATYNFTLRMVTANPGNKNGFSITTGGTTNGFLGTWVNADAANTAISGTAGTGDGIANAYVSHTTTGANAFLTNWSLRWVAPAAGSGRATFYVSTVIGNGSGYASDEVFETNWVVNEDTNAAPVVAIAQPGITNVSPSRFSNSVNTTLTIRGSNFMSNAVARFGSSALATTYVSNNQLTALVPYGFAPGAYSLTVTNTNGGSVTLANALTNLASQDGMKIIKSTINPDSGETCQVLAQVAKVGTLVTGTVYNLLGQPVRSFTVTGASLWQTITWNGANDAGTAVPDGVYLLRLQTPDSDRLVRVYILRPR